MEFVLNMNSSLINLYEINLRAAYNIEFFFLKCDSEREASRVS